MTKSQPDGQDASTAGIGAANMAPGEGLQGFEAYSRFRERISRYM